MTLEEAVKAYVEARNADGGAWSTTREKEKAAVALAESYLQLLKPRGKPTST